MTGFGGEIILEEPQIEDRYVKPPDGFPVATRKIFKLILPEAF